MNQGSWVLDPGLSNKDTDLMNKLYWLDKDKEEENGSREESTLQGERVNVSQGGKDMGLHS